MYGQDILIHDSDAEAANKMQNSFISKYTGVICVLHVTGPIAFFILECFSVCFTF